MAVESKHPSYTLHQRDWEACRDVYHGQSAVKARDGGKRYLSPTTGQVIDGMVLPTQQGWQNYAAYRDRALLSGFFADAVDTFLGMLWHRPPVLELGPLEAFFGEDRPATSDGETLMQLLRRIHVEQMVTGRLGLLADMPAAEAARPTPYIEMYSAEAIINWDDGARELARRTLNLVVLDESGYVRGPSLEWSAQERYRLLALGDVTLNESEGLYRVAVVEQGGSFDPSALTEPTLWGKPLTEVPFVFCGTKSTTTQVDDPPFLALAQAVIALYRMDADYRQYLHMQGQETLLTIGAAEDEVSAVGAGAHINIANPKGSGMFIGVSGAGLGEMRQALENDRATAAKKAGELLSDNSKQRESGEALAYRVGSKSASILDIAHTSAEALQRMLRLMARWMGSDPAAVETIKVIPNERFASPHLVTKDMSDLVQAYVLGAPITLESIHEYNVQHGYTTLTWEEMIAAKRSEAEQLADLLPMPAPSPGNGADDGADAEPTPAEP
jgi:hypothetical protein